MAMERCSICRGLILFGAATFEGRPCCPSCRLVAEARRNAAAARQDELRVLNSARTAYEEALTRLRSAPSDPDARERALSAGRFFASQTRHMAGSAGVTVFDEVALSNDIHAASAAS